jgi:hypothetical protein
VEPVEREAFLLRRLRSDVFTASAQAIEALDAEQNKGTAGTATELPPAAKPERNEGDGGADSGDPSDQQQGDSMVRLSKKVLRAEAAKKAWEYWGPWLERLKANAAEMRVARDSIYRELFSPEYPEAMAAAGGFGSPGGQGVMTKADQEWQKLTGLPVLCNVEAWRAAAIDAGYSPAQTDEITLEDVKTALCAWAIAKVAKQRRVPAANDARDDAGGNRKWWHEPTEQRPTEYKYGPITGQKKDICTWMGEKPSRNMRRLNQKANKTVWVIKLAGKQWEVWFKDDRTFQSADSNRRFGSKPPPKTTP